MAKKNKSQKGNRAAKFNEAAYRNACRQGEYSARFENENGFVAVVKVHRTKKSYSRKNSKIHVHNV